MLRPVQPQRIALTATGENEFPHGMKPNAMS
jgi:hypothetical protein